MQKNYYLFCVNLGEIQFRPIHVEVSERNLKAKLAINLEMLKFSPSRYSTQRSELFSLCSLLLYPSVPQKHLKDMKLDIDTKTTVLSILGRNKCVGTGG